MITKLKIRNNSVFLYLTQAMLQLLHIDPENAFFIFTLKEKCLYISKADIELQDSPYVVRISKVGNGWGIYMTRAMLEFIDVNPENDSVEIDIEGEMLLLKKQI